MVVPVEPINQKSGAIKESRIPIDAVAMQVAGVVINDDFWS